MGRVESALATGRSPDRAHPAQPLFDTLVDRVDSLSPGPLTHVRWKPPASVLSCPCSSVELRRQWYVDSGSQVGELQTLTLVGVFDIVLVSKHNSSCVPVCTHSHDLTKAVSVKSSTDFGMDLKNTLVGPGTPPPPG